MNTERITESENSSRSREYKKPGREPYQRVIDNIYEFTGRRWLLPEITSWLKDSDKRFFILTGLPGTGKSSIAAWLAGFGSTDSSNQDLSYLHSQIRAVHFTQHNLSNTVKNLAENLAEQLGHNVEGFGQVLLSMQSKGTFVLNINKMDIGHVDELNFFKNVDFIINSSNSVDIFNDMVREPLRKLYNEQHYEQAMMIVIDGLDEEFGEGQTISSMLASLDDDPKFPRQLRFLITTRPENRVLQYFRNSDPFDLINSPSKGIKTDDIREYATNKLRRAKVEDKTITRLVDKVSTAADDNFLYAYMLVKDLLSRLPEIPYIAEGKLPNGLHGLYTDFLNRLFGTRRKDWINTYSKILGLLTIQQGEGFYGLQLEQIAKISIDNIVTIKQFVDGNYNDFSGRPKGPFRIFHKSFADFLIDDSNNKDYHLDTTAMHRSVVEYYLKDVKNVKYEIDWSESEDYLLRYLTFHLYAVIEECSTLLNQETERNDIARGLLRQVRVYCQILYQLARDSVFRKAQRERFPGDNRVVLSSEERAISAAAVTDDAPAIAEFMIKHARALSEIKLESPFETMRNKKSLESALNTADLYDVEICSLWYFLMAWEFKYRNNLGGSQLILKRLLEKDLVRLSDFLVPMLEIILPELIGVDKKTLSKLCGKLIGDSKEFSEFYALNEDFDAALQNAQGLSDQSARSHALAKIAKVQARIDKDSAKATFDTAVQEAMSIADDYKRSKALAKIAELRVDKDSSKSLFDAAIHVAKSITAVYGRSQALADIARLQAKAGEFDAAMHTAENTEDYYYRSQALTDIAELRAGIDEVGAKPAIDAVVRAARNLTANSVRSQVLAKIAKVQARIDRDGAKSTFASAVHEANMASNEDSRSQALADIAKLQAEAGDLDAATQTAESIIYAPYRLAALDEVTAFRVQADKEVERVMADAELRDQYAKSLVLVKIAVLKANEGKFDAAVQVAGSITVNSDRLKALARIAELQARMDKDGAMGTFATAIQTAESMAYAYSRSETLANLAKLQAEAGEFDAAIQTTESIKDDYSRSQALVNVSILQAKAGELDTALQTAESIKDEFSRSLALANIAILQAKAGEFDAAIQTAESIKDEFRRSSGNEETTIRIGEDGVRSRLDVVAKEDMSIADDYSRSETLYDIAVLQAEAGEFDAAIQTAESIKDEFRRSPAIGDIARLRAKAGEFDAAIQTAESIKDDYSRSQALADIANIQAKAGEFDAAIQTAESIKDYYNRSQALANIAILQAKAGELDTALQTAESIEDDYIRSQALANIANIQAKAGEFDAAILIAESIAYDYRIKDEFSRSQALVDLARIRAKAGELDAAIQTTKDIKDEFSRSLALANIAILHSEAGEFDAAIQAAKDIVNDVNRFQALVDIAKLYSEAGEFDAAIQAAKDIENDVKRSQVLSDIAKLQAEAGEFDAAIQTTKVIRDEFSRSQALVNVSILRAKAGEFDAAIQATKEIVNDVKRSQALADIAKLQAETGEFDAAIDTIKSVIAERNIHLFRITRVMVKAGDRKRFKRTLLSSAQQLHTAYQSVGLLFEVYKDQSKPLSETIRRLVEL